MKRGVEEYNTFINGRLSSIVIQVNQTGQQQLTMNIIDEYVTDEGKLGITFIGNWEGFSREMIEQYLQARMYERNNN